MYLFLPRCEVHNRDAEGLAKLAQKMVSLSDVYVVTQAATMDGIILKNRQNADKSEDQ